jgi:hypothetical protein
MIVDKSKRTVSEIVPYRRKTTLNLIIDHIWKALILILAWEAILIKISRGFVSYIKMNVRIEFLCMQ